MTEDVEHKIVLIVLQWISPHPLYNTICFELFY
jgi:hypothetical protein